jgi:hypothetical protein
MWKKSENIQPLQHLIALSPDVDRALVNPDYNPEYKYDRLTTRSNIDIAVTDDLKLGIDMSFRFGFQNRPGTYDVGLSQDVPGKSSIVCHVLPQCTPDLSGYKPQWQFGRRRRWMASKSFGNTYPDRV